MSWRLLLILPAVGILIGEPVSAPRLRPDLSPDPGSRPQGFESYLLAYSLLEEDRALALALAIKAERAAREPELRSRVNGLLRKLCPSAGNGPHPCL